MNDDLSATKAGIEAFGEAIETFADDIEAAYVWHLMAGSDLVGRRQAMCDQLLAMLEFVEPILDALSPRSDTYIEGNGAEKPMPDNRRNDLAPLRDLLTALIDIDRGVRDPLLAIEHPHNRPPTRLRMEEFRALAAAALEFHYRAGHQSLPEAARDIVKRLGRHYEPDKPDQLIDWREAMTARLKKDSHTKEFTRQLYQSLLRDLTEKYGSNFAGAADELLQQIENSPI